MRYAALPFFRYAMPLEMLERYARHARLTMPWETPSLCCSLARFHTRFNSSVARLIKPSECRPRPPGHMQRISSTLNGNKHPHQSRIIALHIALLPLLLQPICHDIRRAAILLPSLLPRVPEMKRRVHRSHRRPFSTAPCLHSIFSQFALI